VCVCVCVCVRVCVCVCVFGCPCACERSFAHVRRAPPSRAAQTFFGRRRRAAAFATEGSRRGLRPEGARARKGRFNLACASTSKRATQRIYAEPRTCANGFDELREDDAKSSLRVHVFWHAIHRAASVAERPLHLRVAGVRHDDARPAGHSAPCAGAPAPPLRPDSPQTARPSGPPGVLPGHTNLHQPTTALPPEPRSVQKRAACSIAL